MRHNHNSGRRDVASSKISGANRSVPEGASLRDSANSLTWHRDLRARGYGFACRPPGNDPLAVRPGCSQAISRRSSGRGHFVCARREVSYWRWGNGGYRPCFAPDRRRLRPAHVADRSARLGGLLEAFRQFSVVPDSTHPDAALSGQPFAAAAIANA